LTATRHNGRFPGQGKNEIHRQFIFSDHVLTTINKQITQHAMNYAIR